MGEERAPVDRHGDPRPQQRRRPAARSGSRWPAPMAGPSPRPAAAPRRPGELVHPGEEVGVAGEVDARPPATRKPTGSAARARAAARRRGRQAAHLDRPTLTARPTPSSLTAREARCRRRSPRSARHQQRQRAAEPAQGAEVEVVVVQVGDQHRVDAARDERWTSARDGAGGRPGGAARIGEQAGAVHVDQHGGVADVGDPIADRNPRSLPAGLVSVRASSSTRPR